MRLFLGTPSVCSAFQAMKMKYRYTAIRACQLLLFPAGSQTQCRADARRSQGGKT